MGTLSRGVPFYGTSRWLGARVVFEEFLFCWGEFFFTTVRAYVVVNAWLKVAVSTCPLLGYVPTAPPHIDNELANPVLLMLGMPRGWDGREEPNDSQSLGCSLSY